MCMALRERLYTGWQRATPRSKEDRGGASGGPGAATLMA